MSASVSTDAIVSQRKYRPLWRVRLDLAQKSFKSSWALFTENPIGLVGLAIIVFFGLFAAAHPILMATVWTDAVYNPVTGIDLEAGFHPAGPTARHLLGTDPLGRDVLSQLMFSTRFEFALGVISAVITVLIATTVGAIAAYYGGWLDTILMRFADLVIMVPLLPILIVLSAIIANFGMIELAIALGILAGFGGNTIIIKSQALTVKVKPYIEAARIAGGSDRHIILRHMVPNLMPIALLYMMFVVTNAIFIEAVLSFFGLTEIEMSWGLMINTTSVLGYLLRFDTWYLLFPASISITVLCSAFYLVGRALDEVVNPRLRQR
jgi:peptide/nickel transport system permease protein